MIWLRPVFLTLLQPMEREEREILRKRLDKKVIRTREKIESLEEMTKPVSPENSIGRISRMDAINNKSVMEAALRTARDELEGLEYAQNHIDDDDFGKCKKCENPIHSKRLLLLPGSQYCVHCAS